MQAGEIRIQDPNRHGEVERLLLEIAVEIVLRASREPARTTGEEGP